MKRTFGRLALAATLLLAACGQDSEPAQDADLEDESVTAPFTAVPEGDVALQLHGFHTSFEIAPVLLAADRFFPEGISIKQGGIPNLVGLPVSPNYGEEGTADIATHAETQLLRFSVDHPNLRAIMTVTEGDYRIVARRSAGIEELADLRGKKIGTLANTSAVFFLQKMLESAGLSLDDVEVHGDLALDELGEALAAGDVDALAIWEPESAEGELALGEDAISFSGEGIYREIFNLNTTAENLADPEKRSSIKQFLKALIAAREAMQEDPRRAQNLVSQMSGLPADLIEASWPHHTYLAGKADDIIDVLVEEEQWLAERAGRIPRSRADLEKLVDYSLLDEARAELAAGQ